MATRPLGVLQTVEEQGLTRSSAVARSPVQRGLQRVIDDVAAFSAAILRRWAMRRYQIPVARAVAESVIEGLGRQFVIVFSRQAGKDETLVQLCAFLLTRYSQEGGSIVVAAPTNEQADITRARLEERLKGNALTSSISWASDNKVGVGRASAVFLSTQPKANIRGHTASLLLVANEAQDIDEGIYDSRVDPMGASTNATTVYMGTTWTKKGLLSREMGHLAALEEADGVKRVYRVPWRQVAEEVPAYGERVKARIAKLGAGHPYIRTEYELEELDSEGGLFGPGRVAQVQGDHQRCRRAGDGPAGARYVLLIDVAGEEETDPGPQAFDSQSKRDATALTVVRLTDLPDRQLRYDVVDRMGWTGVKHPRLHGQIVDLARNVWKATAVIVDGTGVGAGLTSFLAGALAPRIHVYPFVFTQASKSQLAWDLLGVLDSGRLKEYRRDDDTFTAEFYHQLGAVEYEILPGPGRLIRWSVPQSKGHDDFVLSWALIGYLDELDLRRRIAKGSVPE
jgi:hypothetical protein